ncbi:zf-HC2 domain-containing protein [Streptacidiphilus sp. ASG 303]|uniref:zf-HC2 domain-containing protein n=1 Tax=Streptacidiphilus sp. ASG 303 TaxID=2896847 RepID=UPI001E3405C4|nr:zf-HC2 domain-containing protein [Streptacidiphilus sp. ASG 303]MCD0483149.1 zf-HC2 domain-containing protein [Streptacidiphilus sp. ASG 303]
MSADRQDRWHLPADDLEEYARGALEAPRLWSADAHLAACPACRDRLNGLVDPAVADLGWARLDAELDAPRPGPLERVLVRAGVADHTARLLAATPLLRRSWLGAVAVVLLCAVAAGRAVRGTGEPLLLLGVAPLLPLAGVAFSFGPRLDPMYETAVVAPLHSFRLLMVRTAAVLAVTVPLSGLAALALPSFGPDAFGWLLPALALTAAGLALTPRLGPVAASALVGGGWVALLVAERLLSDARPLPLTAAGQLTAAALAAAAGALLFALRDRFDSGRVHDSVRPLTAGRLT